ncbi:MAG TPA: aconitate hydratase [Acidimicrobiales bacterium]|nr:aconitate hydratase [Acidimicrobiales bacterium]
MSRTLQVGDDRYEIWPLGDVDTLPFSLKVLLENLLRNGADEDAAALAAWDPAATVDRELAFSPARILMQDFTGVPAVVDLAAMRDAVVALGGDPARINPLVPAELVIDHSISVDVAGVADAVVRNVELEFGRNVERYRFLKWGQQAFDGLLVVPPNTGICHQVNLEYLARVVFVDDAGRAYPDTLVGTDSHTTMINGLGVLGWGVGGIEAEAAMLGQAVSMLTPKVVGFRLHGELREGATATDLVLTVTELLRRHGVVGKFVEFYGPGVGAVPVENRATIGNMSPEYGSTCAIFPIDDETLRYLRFTGRDEQRVALVEAYAKEQGLWHEPDREPRYSEHIELDLGTVVPSIAGPSRPQDRVALDEAKARFREALGAFLGVEADTPEHASALSFPASDPPAAMGGVTGTGEPDNGEPPHGNGVVPDDGHEVTLADGTTYRIDHGKVVIAAITSCTNTSNPYVMVAAGLLAKKAVERGIDRKPWVKASLAPGSRVVTDYFERAGLTPYLDKLGFNLVGYGCTTCIGNSGPLAPELSQAIADADLSVAAVLSGNRNFEGRINPDVRMNYLASPPLVVAYALAGTMDWDPYAEAFPGTDVFLRDVWPTSAEVEEVVRAAVDTEMYRQRYATVLEGDERWRSLDVATGERFEWDPESTYVRLPPYFDDMPVEPVAPGDIDGARVLALLGDSITTDHISPAGSIRRDGPAAAWLQAHGVPVEEFNSFGSRRGNHEVMLRGTFGNIRLRNRLAPGTEGGVTRHLPSGEQLSIYDAAERYRAEGVPLVVVAGTEYGSGSSRDWAAKGTALLGVRAVLARSFERIHRSNLVGMGVLPLELPADIELTGEEVVTIVGIGGRDPEELIGAALPVQAGELRFEARCRIDTPTEAAYFRHGGILPYVLRQLATRPT